MLVHVSPSEDDVAETICSLSFAKRARAVESTRETADVKMITFLAEPRRFTILEMKKIPFLHLNLMIYTFCLGLEATEGEEISRA